MAKDPRTQQRTDARRIGRGGSGKLDATGPQRPARRRRPGSGRAPGRDTLRRRLLSQRQAAVDELTRLGISPEIDERTGTVESPFEEGDAAQASERNDMGFAQRQRVAERINRLTHALERLERGEYETCESCGRPIEPARLAALPEVTLCRDCQERLERGQAA
jgi:RNA polymerase-binding transcription factor